MNFVKIIIAVIIVCSSCALYAGEQNNHIIWWNIYGGLYYGKWEAEEERFGGDIFLGAGMQFSIFDFCVSINPPALLLGIITKEEIGIKLIDSDSFFLRSFIGSRQVNRNQDDIYSIYIGIDIGLVTIKSGSCCMIFSRDKSRLYLSMFYERFYGFDSYGADNIFHGIGAGIGCRW